MGQEHQGEINAPGPEADGRDEDPSAKGDPTLGPQGGSLHGWIDATETNFTVGGFISGGA